MNILQLVPKLNIGGVEKSTIEVSRYLVRHGHKAVVVSGGGDLEKDLERAGVRHYLLPIGEKNLFSIIYSYFKLKSIVRRENIDIIHARSRIPAIIGYFVSRSTKRVMITTAHGQYKNPFTSKAMGWGKAVITANETMARYMNEKYGVPLQKITVISRGVDLEEFSYIPPLEKRTKTIRIGMIARFTPLKGHLDFLEAASLVLRKARNVEIILMGDKTRAKEEYIKKIEMTMRRFMLERVVKFKDTSESVSKVLANLDILVSASKEQEAFGRVIIEAQARGVPVVATRVGGVVENVVDGVTGLMCEPKNPASMAEKIMRYIRNPELAAHTAQNARREVEKRFPLEKVMKETLELYNRVLKMKSILIFKMSSLGDIILSVPSLRAVRERFPGSVIKVLTSVKFRDVLERCPYVDEVITCDFERRDSGMGFLKLGARLSLEGFDISIDLQNNLKSHLLAFLAGSKERYGYNNGKASFLLNRKANLPEKPIGPVEHQAHVLKLLGITNIENRLELFPREEDITWAKDFLKSNWLKENQKIVAFSLSASERWMTKNWGTAKMAELADMLAKQGIRTLVLGRDEEKDGVMKFMQKTSAKPINSAARTTIGQLIGLIKAASCLVTGDSAPMHIASGVETPFVAIFGSTDPVRHLVPSKKYKLLYKRVKCAPCYKSECSKDMRCMVSISVKEVFNAVMELMTD